MIWVSANRFGYELLNEAKHHVHIDAIITLSPQATTVMYDGIPIHHWRALSPKIPVHEIEDINQELPLLNRLNPDYIVVCGWRQILKEQLLKTYKNKIIGFHPTLLPFGRGPAPIINSILEGVHDSGLTLYYLDTGVDNGDIIAQHRFTIEPTDYAEDVYNKVIDAGKQLVRTYFPLLVQGKAPRTPQDESQAYTFKKVHLSDNEIQLEEGIENAYRKIRALSHSYQGAFLRQNNKKLIIWKADLEHSPTKK